MQQATPHQGSSNSPRTRAIIGLVAMIVGALIATVGTTPVSAVEAPATQTVPLDNQGAGSGSDCPDGTNDYWHFVTAPNNDSFAFVSITLSLSGESFTFSGADIIPNGTQLDNVFVAVPGDYELDDIEQAGSSAEITPATGDVKFVLSHLCDGTSTTTSSTTTSTTSTSTTSTSTSTTSTSTTSTVPCEWNPQLPPDDPGCTPPTSTTTEPPEPTLEIEALRPVCVADTPYIEYAIALNNIEAATATLELRDVKGGLVDTLTGMPLSGRIIWPGASVDPLDWPGWKLEGDLWVPDDTDTLLRDGIFVTAIVNPEATAEVSYPPATAACNGPEISNPTTTTSDVDQRGPTTTAVDSGSATTVTVAPELPETGSGSTRTMVLLGMGLMLFGLTLLLGSRRPQTV